MTVAKQNANSIEIRLNSREIACLLAEKQRLFCRTIVKTKSRRMLIELKAVTDGCSIKLTDYIKKPTCRQTASEWLLSFENGEALLKSADILKGSLNNIQKSQLYRAAGKYFVLAFTKEENLLLRLREYCDDVSTDKIKIAQLKEYGECIIHENAAEKICREP